MTERRLTLSEVAVTVKRNPDFACQIGSLLAMDAIRSNANPNSVEPPITPGLDELLENPDVQQLVGFATLLGARFTDEVRDGLEGAGTGHFPVHHIVQAAEELTSGESF